MPSSHPSARYLRELFEPAMRGFLTVENKESQSCSLPDTLALDQAKLQRSTPVPLARPLSSQLGWCILGPYAHRPLFACCVHHLCEASCNLRRLLMRMRRTAESSLSQLRTARAAQRATQSLRPLIISLAWLILKDGAHFLTYQGENQMHVGHVVSRLDFILKRLNLDCRRSISAFPHCMDTLAQFN